MKKVTLYVGLNDKDTKTQVITTVEAYKIALNTITTFANGGTIFDAKGIYKHENGEIVIENTLRIELIDVSENALASIISILKTVLNQESIIKQTEVINSEFC